MSKFTSEDVGRRVIYTYRNGNERLGMIREVLNVSATNQMVDVKLDGMVRERNYIPYDMLRFAPEDDTTSG